MKVFLLAKLLFLVTIYASAQESDTLSQGMSYLFSNREALNVTQSELQEAINIEDIHNRYPADWVSSYISTEITVTKNGKSTKAIGKERNLTKEQKFLLKNAEIGSEVFLWVKYMPNNNLQYNTEKEMDYTFQVIPFSLAEFASCEEAQDKYIEKHIIAHLNAEQKKRLDIGKILFTVTAEGKIADVTIPVSPGDAKIDSILTKGICEMPNWTAAKDSNGKNVDQTIKFLITNPKSQCLLNLH